jgi:hypothetical protein
MAAETYEAMQARLTKVFEMVEAKTHWKDPIDRTMDAAMFEAAGGEAAFREAVTHFTATVPKFTYYPEGVVRVTAKGYRAGPAGDH